MTPYTKQDRSERLSSWPRAVTLHTLGQIHCRGTDDQGRPFTWRSGGGPHSFAALQGAHRIPRGTPRATSSAVRFRSQAPSAASFRARSCRRTCCAAGGGSLPEIHASAEVLGGKVAIHPVQEPDDLLFAEPLLHRVTYSKVARF